MKANLLFQYKKPEYITKSIGSEWKHWKEPYFRYSIYKEQQDLLMQIDKKFNSKVLVIYASPAVQDINELVSLKRRGKIISSSNFKRSADLDGHHRNTYIKSGTFSIACSKPVSIKNFDLLPELELMGNSSDFSNKENNRSFIIEFRKEMEALIYQDEYYGNSLKNLNSEIGDLEDFELLYSFLVMANFRLMTGIQWIVKL